MTKVKRSSSIVIHIKVGDLINEQKNKSEIKIKRQAKQILNHLMWQESYFENAAAICNIDGSKSDANKSRFKIALKGNLGISEKTPKSTEQDHEESVFAEKEWLTDSQLHRCIKSVVRSEKNETYSMFYPLPTAVLIQIMREKSSKTILPDVLNKECNCIVPLNVGLHWVTVMFHGKSKKIYYMDSLGNAPDKLFISEVKTYFHGWPIIHNTIKIQYDSYQCGIWCCHFVSICVNYPLNKERKVLQNITNLQTPNEHYKRVSGVYKYMLGYIHQHLPPVEWCNYGFQFDTETKQYQPKIFMTEIHSESRKRINIIEYII